MSRYIVRPNGPLKGNVRVIGAKNAVLPIIAATILTKEPCVLDDVPDLADVKIMDEIINSLGGRAEFSGDEKKAEICCENIENLSVPKDLAEQMRASILVIGALLGRFGKGIVPLPGGCAIGKRPIGLHAKGLEALGADVRIDEIRGCMVAQADRLVGSDIYLDFPSVGATETIIMAATLAEGTTVIYNAAQEPEIVDLANFLSKMGAKIKGAGTDTIKIIGRKELKGARHRVIPDRIEAGTYMIAAAITRGEVLVENMVVDHLRPLIAKLIETGVDVKITEEGIYVNAVDKKLKPTDIKTLPYPGFPTDLQSPFMAYLATVEGVSTIIETVFENRFMHADEFSKLGASIITNGKEAKIDGTYRLKGSSIRATDLRAGAAMILLGLVATGETSVYDIYHIDRGYDSFMNKLRALGADIERIEE